MAVVRINRSGTYYETYQIADSRVSAEQAKLTAAGLIPQSVGDEPATDCFVISFRPSGAPSIASRFSAGMATAASMIASVI